MSLRLVRSPAAPKITITHGLAGSPAFRSVLSASRDIDPVPLSSLLLQVMPASPTLRWVHTCFSPTKQARNTHLRRLLDCIVDGRIALLPLPLSRLSIYIPGSFLA